jgi:hypothetical protein
MKKTKKEKVSSSSTDKMFIEQPVEMTKPNESQKVTVKGNRKSSKTNCYLVLIYVRRIRSYCTLSKNAVFYSR